MIRLQGTMRRMMMINKRKFVLHIFITIIIFIFIIKLVKSNNMKAMYVLGDSSVDCGENTLFFPYLLHNLSLHPCDGSPLSSLIPHLLEKKIGLPYSIPFYSQNGSTEVLLRGVNLGSIGATIMSNPSNPTLQSLNHQLRQAFEIFELLQLQLGQETADDFIQSSALFYLSFGKDEYVNLFRDNPTGSIAPNMPYILVNQVSNAIKYLYGSSARKFVFMGLLPLGCAPRFLGQTTNDSTTARGGNGGGEKVVCANEINNLVLQYNGVLEQRIIDLNKELDGARLIFCDVYHAMMEAINNPKIYGFENVKSGCCGIGKSGCMSMEMVCHQPSTFLWWDLFTPGQTLTSFLADSVWSGQPFTDICRPFTVHQLVSS